MSSRHLKQRSRTSLFKALVVAGGTIGLIGDPAKGVTYTWTATTSGTWNNSANWSGGTIPVSGVANGLVFNAAGTTSYTATNDFTDPFILNSLNFANTGTGTIILAGNDIAFGAATTITGTGTNIIENAITGSFGLTKTGAGTVILTGSNAYTTTAANAGILQIGNGGTSGTVGTGNVAIGANGTLIFNRSDTYSVTNVLTGTGNIVMNGSGTIEQASNSTFTGTLTVNAGKFVVTTLTSGGTFNFNARSIVVNNGGIFQFGEAAPGPAGNPNLPEAVGSATIVTINAGGTCIWQIGEQFGGFVLAGGLLSVDGGGPDSRAVSEVRSGTVSSPTATVRTWTGTMPINKTTSGTVTVDKVNLTTTGGINIQEGVLATNAGFENTSIMSFGTTGASPTAGTLRYTGANATLGKPLVLNDGGGTIEVTTAATVYSASNTISGPGTLTKLGPGTLSINGADTHTGLTTVSGGTLRIGAGGTVGSTIADISVGTGATLAFNRSDAVTYAGNISGAGQVQKLATNVTTLTGTLAYTGSTTVSAGTLRVSPQTLAGPLNVAEGATISMVNGPTAATTTVPSVSLGFTTTGATLKFEVGSTMVPAVPLLNVTTPDGINFNTGAHTLAVTSSQALGVGTFTLIQYAGADITTGFTLAPLPARTIGALQFDTANKQIDLQITSVDSTKWRGDISANWDVGTAVNVDGTNNWRLQSNDAATNFVDGDVVTFDDTAAAGSYTVNLVGQVQPSKITVSNSANNYVFTGAGPITGSGDLVKQGTGSLTILVDNTSTGNTTVFAGSLIVGNGGSTGSLPSGNIVNHGSITLNRAENITFPGTVSGTGSLTKLGTNNLTVVGAYTLAGDTTLGGGRIVLGTGPGFTYNGKITGAGGLTKTGAGTLTLGGVLDYTGTTINSTGSLVLAGAATLPGDVTITAGNLVVTGSAAIAGRVTLNVAATNINFNTAGTNSVSGVISGAGTVLHSGIGTTTLSGANDYTGATTISAGTLQFSGAGILPGNASVGAAGTLVFNQAADVTYSAVISGAGTINKLGTNTLTLEGDNSFTGTLVVNAGTVALVDPGGNLGNLDAASIIVNNTGRFLVGIGTDTNNPDLVGTAVITINPGGIAEFQVGEDYGGIILKGGEYRTSVNSNFTTAVTSILESGTIVSTGAAAALGTNGNGTFRKTTPGTVTLTGVPFLVNLLSIEDGVFSTDSTLSAGGSLTFGTNGAGATGGTLRYRGPTGSLAKPIVVNSGGGTVEITNAATAVQLTGVISGAGPVTKTGPGAVVFTGNNTYSGGTTVSAGTLLANNAAGSGTGTGPLSVSAGATFGGTGSIASQLTLDGMLTPGVAAVGILRSSSTATFQDASIFSVELGDVDPGDTLPPIPGTDHDQFVLTGTGTTATLAPNARLALTVLPGIVDGQQFTILDNQNGGLLTGIFSDAGGSPLANGAIFTAGGRQFQINYPDGDVVLTAVPEPATAGMLALVAAGLLARRRRRAV